MVFIIQYFRNYFLRHYFSLRPYFDWPIGWLLRVFQRDQRSLLASYIALMIVTIRFAGSKVEFGLVSCLKESTLRISTNSLH